MTEPIDFSVANSIVMALEAAAYLRDEADFNRSWTDGRRGAPFGATPEYFSRRLEIAEERERWAAAIEALAAERTLKARADG